jgi:hypothetical protein
MVFTRTGSLSRPRLARAGALAIALLSAALFSSRAQSRPVEGLPYIYSVEIVGEQPCDTCPPQVCPERPYRLRIAGELTDACVRYQGLEVTFLRGSPTPRVTANFYLDSCFVACPTVVTAFTDSVDLPGLSPGSYTQWVESVVWSCPDSQAVRSGARPFKMDVLGSCGDPPPIDSLLRSFLRFQVLPQPPCPLDTLSLQMATNNCPPCLNFLSFGPDIEGRPFAVVEWRPNCLELACIPESLSFQMGQFQAGSHNILVDVIAHIVGTENPDSLVAFQVNVGFQVPLACDTTGTGCVFPFLAGRTLKTGQCALELVPGGEGVATVLAGTNVPLGGLQGVLEVREPFRVTGVFPPDLPGMHVSWVPDGRGARWVVFTTDGRTIPIGRSPVFRVALAADTGAANGTYGMVGRVELASDPHGIAVPLCPITFIRVPDIPLCISDGAQACDVNSDALSDVRDLVLMTNCLLLDPPPGGTALCQDCDGDGGWAFHDLLCCAEQVLRLPMPPRDSIGLGPQVTIEEIATDEAGTELRVRITGADQLGAAMLRLRYPGERWHGLDARVQPFAAAEESGWFPIVDVELPGVIQLGGLKLAATAGSELVFRLRFNATEEPRDGDQVVVEGADLAASDGTAFTLASLPRFTLSKPLPPLTRVELGAPRPNPFQRTTSFRLSLPQPARVELTMHDLFGRRVATLLHGQVSAGHRDVPWDGAGLRDGIYFARLVIDGRVYTQRVALLRDRR